MNLKERIEKGISIIKKKKEKNKYCEVSNVKTFLFEKKKLKTFFDMLSSYFRRTSSWLDYNI